MTAATLADHRGWLETHVATITDIIADADLSLTVPSCPDWTLSDLAIHVGRVHQMATAALRDGDPETRPRTAGPDGDLNEWFTSGARELLDAIDSRDQSHDVWTFMGPRPASFWTRRMSNETAIHAWDATTPTDATWSITAPQGVDLVDEFLEVYVPRIGPERFADAEARTFHLHATDAAGEWEIRRTPDGMTVHHEHAKSTTAVRGPAADLALFIWSRGDMARLEVFGDEQQVQQWQSSMVM